MSTYPVDIKAHDITSASTTTVFNGPARVLGVSWTQPTNVGAGTITINDNTTAVWVIHVPASNVTDHKAPVWGQIMLPGTGIKVDTSLKVTNAITTHVTIYYG
jgi:hypothetical protein|tara:strand:+ start:326 stop:634 length:309 start_codon:yes stop_codon:yes gene_type:complete